jgi:hypothetical protein
MGAAYYLGCCCWEKRPELVNAQYLNVVSGRDLAKGLYSCVCIYKYGASIYDLMDERKKKCKAEGGASLCVCVDA